MLFKLISIEWTRLSRRALFWLTLAACALFIGLSLENFYTLNQAQILDGSTKLPGVSYDLANSLDQLLIVALPFLVILGGLMMGNDYSQRANQHWLMRASRPSSLLAKFAMLAIFTFGLQIFILLVGGLIGFYYKTFVYHSFSFANVNGLATLAAPFYMTLVTLPYLALMLLVTVATRSTFAAIAIGLGYTQFVEFILSGFFYSANWAKWMPRGLYLSGTYLLNSIGNRVVNSPANLFAPGPAFIFAAIYTLVLLFLAIWLYRRQDLGG
jgi:hypothetical protein